MNELRPKLFDVMKGYTKEQLIKDIISGIIVAIIALPLSIALAIASGVGPEQGLYTAIIAGFFISFFGGSRVQIGGPTAAFVVIIYGIVEQYGTDGLIVATILAGIILVIMGICRFGSLIKYIPYTITTGFTCGSFRVFKQSHCLCTKYQHDQPHLYNHRCCCHYHYAVLAKSNRQNSRFPDRNYYHNCNRIFCKTPGKYNWQCLR